MTDGDLQDQAFRWSEELRFAVNSGDRNGAVDVFSAASNALIGADALAIVALLLGELVQFVHDNGAGDAVRGRHPGASTLLDDFAVFGRSGEFFSEVMKFLSDVDTDTAHGVVLEYVDVSIACAAAGDIQEFMADQHRQPTPPPEPPEAAATGSTDHYPLGLSAAAYRLLTSYEFTTDDVADQVRELDYKVSSDGFDMDWHEMTVAQIVGYRLSNSDGRTWPEEAAFRLAGAFVAGARLGEVVFGVQLPLGEPYASGDFGDQSLALLSTPDEVMDVVSNHLPKPMMFWLLAGYLGGLGRSLAPIPEEETHYPGLAATLAGLAWVGQAVSRVEVQHSRPSAPPAGWYDDPEGPGKRWWDGTAWTEHRNQPAPPPEPRRSAPPAGWYDNPEAPGKRWWDGTAWTEHRSAQ